MRSVKEVCLLLVAVAALSILPAHAESPPAEARCATAAAVSTPLQLARMDPSKCVIWCRIKRSNCAEDCAATASDKLKICKQGCLATFEACTQRCS